MAEVGLLQCLMTWVREQGDARVGGSFHFSWVPLFFPGLFPSSSGRWACSYQAIRAGCWAVHRGPWWRQEMIFPSLWALPSKCYPPLLTTQEQALGPLFTDEKQPQRGEVTCLRLHSWDVAKWGFERSP